jgi:aminoglycoside N3'-acetyltransferase
MKKTVQERVRTLVRSMVRGTLQTDDVGKYIRLRRLELNKKIYRNEFTLPELRDVLMRLGFARGRVVWVQSSWNEFYNFRGRPSELIAVMRDLLGPEGTLVMPAFPIDQNPRHILEIDDAPSSTGLLTEIFRRSRDVERSIHLSSSVCAVGPAASFLTGDHHRDIFAWGSRTPYCRMLEMDALLVGLGISRFPSYFTVLHAVECRLYDEIPFFRHVFDGTISYRWRRRSGEEGDHQFMQRIGRIQPRQFGRYFPKESYKWCKISNLDTVSIAARTLMDRAIELGRNGITIYDKSSLPLDQPK